MINQLKKGFIAVSSKCFCPLVCNFKRIRVARVCSLYVTAVSCSEGQYKEISSRVKGWSLTTLDILHSPFKLFSTILYLFFIYSFVYLPIHFSNDAFSIMQINQCFNLDLCDKLKRSPALYLCHPLWSSSILLLSCPFLPFSFQLILSSNFGSLVSSAFS